MSNITASTSLKPRRWLLPVAAAVIALTILAAMVTADPARHWISLATTDWDGAWWEWAGTNKDKQAQRLAMPDRGISTAIPEVPAQNEVLVYGNSAAREAFDARAFTKATGITAHNFGLTTVSIGDFHLAGFKPAPGSTVLLILNGPAMDERVRRDPNLPWNRPLTGPAAALDTFNRARRNTAEILTSRSLEAVRRALGRAPDPIRAGDARRVYRYDAPLDADAIAKQAREVRDWYSIDFTKPDNPIKPEALMLKEAKDRADAEGWRLVTAWLPARDAATEVLFVPHHEAAKQVDPNIIDLSPGLVPSNYHDVGHLLASGRAKVTATLARTFLQTAP